MSTSIEETARLLGISNLLRWFVNGSVFSFSLYLLCCNKGSACTEYSLLHCNLGLFSLLSIVAGALIYGLHRSLFYPLFEWIFIKCVWRREKKRFKQCGEYYCMISIEAIDHMNQLWRGLADKSEVIKLRHQRFVEWGNWMHMQYTCSLSIGLALIVAHALPALAVNTADFRLVHALETVMLLCGIAAIVSNVRLFRMSYHLLKHDRTPGDTIAVSSLREAGITQVCRTRYCE